MNNAGVAPISTPSYNTARHWLDRFHSEGSRAVLDSIDESESMRTKLGQFLNAPANQIAFFQSAASAISQVAFGLPFKSGDEIITLDQEYPSNFYPWRDAAKRAGANLVTIPNNKDYSTPLDDVVAKVTNRTRMIAISWVQYQAGAIVDLKNLSAFARDRGILVSADCIQGIGQLPFDFQEMGVDFAIGGSHKWMTSPLGVGFLAAREEAFDRLVPNAVGCLTYGTTADIANINATPLKGPSKLEPGGRPMAELCAFGATIELFQKVGVGRIAQEAEFLAKRLNHGLRERGYDVVKANGNDQRGAIVTFRGTDLSKYRNQDELDQALTKAGITFARRLDGIRLSPHAFNTTEDIAHALSVL